MSEFMIWADSLANHGSDADDRKSWDPNESMRHYIDIDNYAEFISTGHIASTYDSVIALHGQNFVENEGILPWATKNMYDSLKLAFMQHNWHAVILHASDLGHYVGDGHMPLHITKNYNGQYTNQTGVHSRYESYMINNFVNNLNTYAGDTVHFVNNVQKYIFDYLYINYTYIDSVLYSDNYAQTIAGNDNTTQYYQALFDKSKNFTITLWHNASHALAELIYSAWVDAGSPPFSEHISEFNGNIFDVTVSPNPLATNSVLNFNLHSSSKIKISLFDFSGKMIYSNQNIFPSGKNKIKIESSLLATGIYILKIDSGKNSEVVRFLKP